jgi:hypothetical protein
MDVIYFLIGLIIGFFIGKGSEAVIWQMTKRNYLKRKEKHKQAM